MNISYESFNIFYLKKLFAWNCGNNVINNRSLLHLFRYTYFRIFLSENFASLDNLCSLSFKYRKYMDGFITIDRIPMMYRWQIREYQSQIGPALIHDCFFSFF